MLFFIVLAQGVHVELAFINCNVSHGGENVHAAALQTNTKWYDVTKSIATYYRKCDQKL